MVVANPKQHAAQQLCTDRNSTPPDGDCEHGSHSMLDGTCPRTAPSNRYNRHDRIRGLIDLFTVDGPGPRTTMPQGRSLLGNQQPIPGQQVQQGFVRQGGSGIRDDFPVALSVTARFPLSRVGVEERPRSSGEQLDRAMRRHAIGLAGVCTVAIVSLG